MSTGLHPFPRNKGNVGIKWLSWRYIGGMAGIPFILAHLWVLSFLLTTFSTALAILIVPEHSHSSVFSKSAMPKFDIYLIYMNIILERPVDSIKRLAQSTAVYTVLAALVYDSRIPP